MACGSECNQEVSDALHAVETHLAQNNQATTGDPVNVVTGAFLHSEQDVAIGCQRLVLSLVRHYNNQRHETVSDSLLQPFGPGWTHSLGMRMTPSAGDTITYHDDRGSELVFVRSGDGASWIAPPGSLGLTLVVLANNGFRLRQLSGLTAEFTGEGRLSGLMQPGPRGDSRIELSYDAHGRLATCIGISGRGLEFNYRTRTNVIAEVRDHSGRRWSYGYDDHQELVEVCDPLGRCRRYAYSRWTGRVASGRKTTEERTISALTTIFALKRKADATPSVPVLQNSYTTERRVYLQEDGLGNKTRFEYNPFTHTTVVTNALGDSTAYCFDDAGCTTKVRKPSGATTEYVFDDRRNVLAEIDPLGHRTEYVTFSEPQKLDVQLNYGRRAIGNRAAYLAFTTADLLDGYDVDGNRPLVRDASGAVIRFWGYTAFGQPIKVETADGAVFETTYDERSGLPLKRTRTGPTGVASEVLVETWQYDDIGCCTEHRTWAQQPNGARVGAVSVEAFAYDDASQLLQRRSWMEHEREPAPFASDVQYAWNSLGRLVKETQVRRVAPGAPTELRVTQYGYDEVGQLLWEARPDGSARVYEYDTEGHLTERFTVRSAHVNTLPRVATEQRVGRERWSYDAAGREIAYVDPTGAVTKHEWDDCGRCVRITAPSKQETRLGYDRDGNLISQCTDTGHQTNITYDTAGRWITRSDNLGYAVKVSRDALGRIREVSYANGTISGPRYDYDNEGRIMQIRFADGATESFRYDAFGNRCERRRGWYGQEPDTVEWYRFDALGRMESVFVGNGQRRTEKFRYAYDDAAREVRRTDALGNVTVSRYDSVGALVEQVDAEGRRLCFSYDSLGRLIRKWSDDGSVNAEYIYELGDRIAEATEDGVCYRWKYDAAGRVVTHGQDVQGQSRVIAYRHDHTGRVIEKRCDDGWWIRFEYGSSYLPTSLSFPGHTVELTYDQAGRLTGERWLDGGLSTYSYAPTGALTWVRCLDASGNIRWEQSLELDDRQRPLFERRRLGQHETTLAYRYDALNRLTERIVTAPDRLSSVHGYEYDEHQNRIREHHPDTTTRSFVFDAADRLQRIDESGGQRSRTYDRCGLLIHDGVRSYAYDASHRLRAISGANAAESVTLQYAATGEWAFCAREGMAERIYYDGSQAVLSEIGHEHCAQFWGLRPECLLASRERQPVASRIYADIWGSVLGIEAGKPWRDYGPFGEAMAERKERGFGFSSKLYEPTSGLYYNRARFYDPALGRFLQPDPKGLIDGPNVYVFGLNNPVHYGDPEGTEARQHSQGRIAEITPALAFFPSQKEGRTYIVGPSWFETGIHAEHFDRNFNLIGRSYIIGPGWFESKPHVEHYDRNWNVVGRTYVEGPGWFESQSHFQHYGRDWSRTGRTYVEGPGWFESQAHFQHYGKDWGRTGRTYVEGPSWFESDRHFRRYA